MPPNPSELLGSAKMQEVVQRSGEWGDWVIIDTPPLLAVADPASVARWADGVLMVSQAGVTTREAAKKAMELLDKVGARIIGVVVWGLDETKAGSAGYGYYAGGYYYYSSYYGQHSDGARKKKPAQRGAASADPRTAGARRVNGHESRACHWRFRPPGWRSSWARCRSAAYFLAQYMGWDITFITRHFS